MLIFKPYTPEVLMPLSELWHASWLSSDPDVFPDDTPERLVGVIQDNLTKGWHVTLAYEDIELIAFLAILPQESWLDQLFVAPKHQGKNIGLALLELAKATIPDGFKLRTAKSNVNARRFYLRHGLREIGEVTSPYRGTQSVVMAWP
jgi:GNAT superfamily N-acetyltransferase